MLFYNRGDVTYEAFYTYMDCMKVSPCPGWMTSNETRRNETSERAAELSEALKKVEFQTMFMISIFGK